MKQEEKKYREPLELPPDDELVELPGESKVKEQHYVQLFVLLLLSILSAYVLFAFTMESNSLGHLLTREMILPALIYAVPAFVASSYLYEKLVNSYSKIMSIAMSLFISIPLIFMMVMWFLSM